MYGGGQSLALFQGRGESGSEAPGARRWARWSGFLLVSGLAIELLARVFVQFPLYGADSEVGYFILPNQTGSFAGNEWAFNSLGMGVSQEYNPGSKFDILLVGDSIVYGGNQLEQSEKLGPLVDGLGPWSVWPVGAGSWALQNEIIYLNRIEAIRPHLDFVVLVLNDGDFGDPSFWSNNHTHPRFKYKSHAFYLLNRFVFKFEFYEKDKIPVKKMELGTLWAEFAKEINKNQTKLVIIAYDNSQDGKDCGWVPEFVGNVENIYCFNAQAQLGSGGMRDSIHPNALGNARLAQFIVDKIVALRVGAAR